MERPTVSPPGDYFGREQSSPFPFAEKEAGMEATTGFEPVDGGFADLCLTTWLRRRDADSSILMQGCQSLDPGHSSCYDTRKRRLFCVLNFSSPHIGADVGLCVLSCH